ncbi:MAG: methyltransferase domain-containing protein [Desulfurococcales archaeon]|nr:methyltransferase domain-containing protein [Desulfurococcales archaeon]
MPVKSSTLGEYYALLSGEHPRMPLAELQALLETRLDGYITFSSEGIAVFHSTKDPTPLSSWAGWVKEVGRVYGVVEAEFSELMEFAHRLHESGIRFKSIYIKKFRGYSCHVDGRTVKNAYRVLLNAGASRDLRVFITEGISVIGSVLGRQDTRAFNSRKPGKRPFFKPGPLSPQLSRVMVNLSRLKPGDIFLDPFCGTGGFVIEACLLDASRCICGDIAPEMVRGSVVNMKHFNLYDRVTVLRQNSGSMPLSDESVDAIATDPPYGRSTTTARKTYSELVRGFLRESYRVLRSGGYIVYAGPYREEPWRIAEEAGFSVIDRFHMYVHSTLIREVVVARK